MFARMMWAAGTLALLCGVAEAQDGVRSASLPERGFESTSTDGRDLFRVPADFYNRPPDADASRLFVPSELLVFVWGSDWPVPVRGFTGTQVHGFRFTGSRISGTSVPGSQVQGLSSPGVTEGSPAAEATASPSFAPPRTPGKPKTFYLIPGCYAGDRPPALEWLPAGCDMSRMRAIPPG